MARGQSLYDWCQENDFGHIILSQWTGIDKDGNIVDIHNISRANALKVRWKCDKGHEWVADIHCRTGQKQNCPYCSNRRVCDDNSLLYWCNSSGDIGEILKRQYIGQKDTGEYIDINKIQYGSHIKISWKCEQGHIYYQNPLSRIRGRGCPYCSSKYITYEKSLLHFCNTDKTKGPKLMVEWQGYDEKFNKADIDKVFVNSNKKYLWKCSKGHKFLATINLRVSNGTDCPYCNKAGTSYPEQFLYRALLQIYPNTISRGKYQGIEYDISIPEEKTCIEYSGINWHADKLDRDAMKANLCESHGVKFIQVYAHNGQIDSEDMFDASLIIYKVATNKDIHNQQLTEILNHILKQFGQSVSEIDIEKAQTEAFNFMHNIETDDNTAEVDSLLEPEIQIKLENF